MHWNIKSDSSDAFAKQIFQSMINSLLSWTLLSWTISANWLSTDEKKPLLLSRKNKFFVVHVLYDSEFKSIDKSINQLYEWHVHSHSKWNK